MLHQHYKHIKVSKGLLGLQIYSHLLPLDLWAIIKAHGSYQVATDEQLITMGYSDPFLVKPHLYSGWFYPLSIVELLVTLDKKFPVVYQDKKITDLEAFYEAYEAYELAPYRRAVVQEKKQIKRPRVKMIFDPIELHFHRSQHGIICSDEVPPAILEGLPHQYYESEHGTIYSPYALRLIICHMIGPVVYFNDVTCRSQKHLFDLCEGFAAYKKARKRFYKVYTDLNQLI